MNIKDIQNYEIKEKMWGDILSPVQDTFLGETMDLGCIISISNPIHIDRMGHGGHFIQFFMTTETRKHITFDFEIDYEVKLDNNPNFKFDKTQQQYTYQTCYNIPESLVTKKRKNYDGRKYSQRSL